MSSPIFDFICSLSENYEEWEQKCDAYCDDCETEHEYGCDYFIEEMTEKILDDFKAFGKIIKEQVYLETLKGLILLRESLRMLRSQTSFVDEETAKKMVDKIEKAIKRQILQLSYKKELEASMLTRFCAESNMIFADFNSEWLKIPDVWEALAKGEPIKEDEDVTNLRYDVLIDNGDFHLAYLLTKACPTEKIVAAHLENIVEEVKEHPNNLELIDQLFEILTMSAQGERNFELKILVEVMKIIPESRLNDGNKILLGCLKTKPSSVILREIINYGKEEDCKNAIDILRAGKKKVSLDVLRCLLEEVSSRHPSLFDFAFEVGMEVANWSGEHYDVLLSNAKGIDKQRSVLQRIATAEATGTGVDDTCNVLQRLITVVRESCPSLLGQVASLAVNKFDPFTTTNLEVVAKNGDEGVIKKLLERFEKEIGLVGQQRIYPRRIVKQLIDDALPRLPPSFRQTLLDFFQRCFEADPAILQEDLLAIFQCENDFGKLISHIEEKTAFGQQYSSDLPSILNVLLKKATLDAWNGLLSSCLDIALKQFAEHPGNWSFLVLKYAKNDDVPKVVETFHDFIKNNQQKAGSADIFNVIQHLVSQAVNKWPMAMTKIADLLVTYFKNAAFMPSRYEKLFCYRNFWLSNKECLTKCLEPLYFLMKRKNNVSLEWISFMEKLVDLVKDDEQLITMATTMVNQTRNHYNGLKSTINDDQGKWKMDVKKLVPVCPSTRDPRERCGGCLQLVQFLECNVQKRNITVNGNLRNCIKRLLNGYVTGDRLKAVVGGNREPLHKVLNLKFREIDYQENMSKFNSTRCGAVLVEKERPGDQKNQQLAKL